MMNKILLRIEIGDWGGGNNGHYPKILEWNLEDEDSPIDESDGWCDWYYKVNIKAKTIERLNLWR